MKDVTPANCQTAVRWCTALLLLRNALPGPSGRSQTLPTVKIRARSLFLWRPVEIVFHGYIALCPPKSYARLHVNAVVKE